LRNVLADDHRLVLVGIRRALTVARDFEVVGEAHTGTQVLPMRPIEPPDRRRALGYGVDGEVLLTKIYRKLEIANRTEVVRYA